MILQKKNAVYSPLFFCTIVPWNQNRNTSFLDFVRKSLFYLTANECYNIIFHNKKKYKLQIKNGARFAK